jgi:hypothetical protein
MQVIGSQFSKVGAPGDFGWMIEGSEYHDALFIFNDNEEQFSRTWVTRPPVLLAARREAATPVSGRSVARIRLALRAFRLAQAARGIPS